MNDDEVKRMALEEAEVTYKMFLKFCKYVSYVIVAGLVAVASCSFGVDGTGSKSDPELYEEYKERMKEMGEEFKKKKYGG